MNMFDTINNKKSIRKFTKEIIDNDILDDILLFAKEQQSIFPDLNYEFHLIKNTTENKLFTIFNINPTYYLIISATNSEQSFINAGYLMQNINLYLTSLGLGSCFIGNGLPKNIVLPDFQYEYITALAFGYTKEDLFRNKDKAIRLTEDKTVYYKTEVSKDIKEIVEAARFSPSYMNSQPWRFVVYQNKIHIFAKKASLIHYTYKQFRMLDIGVCLANLLIAAEEYWIPTSITEVDSLKSKPFNQNDYVLTVLLDTNIQNI